MEALTIARKETGYPELSQFTAAIDVQRVTARGYEKKVHNYMSWIRETGRVQPTATDIIAYKRELTDRGLTAHSVSAYLSALRRFYGWAEQEGLYPNIAREVKGAKTPREYSRDVLTAKQAREVIEAAQTPRERALIILLLTTGLRTVEVIRADVGDLRTRDNKTTLRVWGKARDGKDDFVVLPESATRAIHDYLGTRQGVKSVDPLFAGNGNKNRGRLTTRTIRRIVKGLYAAAGINSPTITAHSTRHTACTLALKAGVPIQTIQQMARHADIRSTMIYLHTDDKLNAGTTEAVSGAIFNRENM